MKIIVGLGNPGLKYKNTRHNVGFMVTEKLTDKFNIVNKFDSKYNSITGRGIIKNNDVLIIQPQCYMNLSGQPVSKILNYYKVSPSELLVVFDDISIPLGKIKFKAAGSAGGHNGIKSIIESLGGFKDFPRLKIGIGPDPGGEARVSYVLDNFSKPERKILEDIFPVCIEGIEIFLTQGIQEAQNKYNSFDIK